MSQFGNKEMKQFINVPIKIIDSFAYRQIDTLTLSLQKNNSC